MAKRVLIIKLGYCETLVNEDGFTPSLGDVFRHTVLLHRYVGDRVTWLTTESAVPLLKDNPWISELLIYDEETAKALQKREFDELVCLEKTPTICRLANSIKAWSRFGFGWNGNRMEAHPLAQSAVDIANGKDHFLPIQALLYQMVGDYWRGEGYVLGYQPRYRPAFDVGLNFRVGSKWPAKTWPIHHWMFLKDRLESSGFTVNWQEGESDLDQYMDWIGAARLIVTSDSLGMHLGLAMGKKVVALFGASPSNGIYMYGQGEILKANGVCSLAPCMRQTCERHHVCMEEIRPETVLRTVVHLLYDAGAENVGSVREQAGCCHGG